MASKNKLQIKLPVVDPSEIYGGMNDDDGGNFYKSGKYATNYCDCHDPKAIAESDSQLSI